MNDLGIRVWCKIVLYASVKQIKGNEGFTSILQVWKPSSKKFPYENISNYFKEPLKAPS